MSIREAQQPQVLVMGAGNIGDAYAQIASRQLTGVQFTVADYNLQRAQQTTAGLNGFTAVQVNARDPQSLAQLIGARRPNIVVDLLHPHFAPTIAVAALAGGAHYVSTAQSESGPGKQLGDDMYALNGAFEKRGLVGVVDMGADPGISLLLMQRQLREAHNGGQKVNQVTIFDGSNCAWKTGRRRPPMAGFAYQVFVDECTKEGLVWSDEGGMEYTPPLSRGVAFPFGGSIGTQRGLHAQHEEIVDTDWAVQHSDGWLRSALSGTKEVSFQYGMDDDLYGLLKGIMATGMHVHEAIDLGKDPHTRAGYVRAVAQKMGAEDMLSDPQTCELFRRFGLLSSQRLLSMPRTPLDFFTQIQPPPNPREMMSGESDIGVYVRTDRGAVFDSHRMTEDDAQRRYGRGLVPVQTAAGPVVATQMLLDGEWKHPGVHSPLELPTEEAISKWGDIVGPCSTRDMTADGAIYRCWDPTNHPLT